MRPICTHCNRNYCAVNYIREGITHYRSMCDECGRKKKKLRPRVPSWQKAGYNKKERCELCGFHSVYPSQILVYYIDGDLENATLANLRSICLNCVEIVKRKQPNWKKGDLEVDY